MRWLLSLVLLWAAAAKAQLLPQLPPPVAQALARAGIAETGVGLFVQDVGAPEPTLVHRGDLPLNPASVMKLVTTYAGLELLGTAHTWVTELYTDGVTTGNVLTGNVIIKGGGDPKFALEHLWLLARALRAKGVREIRGDLLLDRTLFTTTHPDPGAFDGEPTQPYNVTPDALLTNFKSLAFTFTPDEEAKAVRITIDPPLRQVEVVNNLTLTEGACGIWYARIKTQAQDTGANARITLAGNYARSCDEQVTYYSLLGHREYTGALFAHLWRELGGVFNGRVRDGVASGNAVRVYTHRSLALSESIRDINKVSNNVMARQLLLSMGMAGNPGAGPATPERGARAVQQLFAAKNINMPELVLENGSGLSRIERVTARGLGQMLITAFRGATMPEFMASMPVVGVDGTMIRRLTNTGVAGQAHIKTGLINGVRALAGYVLDAKGRRVAVVLLINHPNAHNANAVQDAFLRWVHAR